MDVLNRMKKVNTDEMAIKVKMGFEDLLKYTFSSYYRKRGTKLWMAVSVGNLLLLSYVLISYYNKYGKINNVALNIYIVVIILFVVGPPVLICYNCKRLINDDKFITTEYTYTFSNRGIKVNSDVSKSMVKWSSISSIKGYKNNIEIYASRNQALIIPVRFLSKENNEPQILKEIFNKYVSKEKLKLK